MIDKINKLAKEQNMNLRQLATKCELSPSVFYSMSNRKKEHPDKTVVIGTDILGKVCKVLNVSPNYFFDLDDNTVATSPEEQDIIRKYRQIDSHGKRIVTSVLDIEYERAQSLAPAAESKPLTKIIPLFTTPAAAGYASPALGSDYTDYEVPLASQADFAVKMDGDSMEPYIKDGSAVLVKRTTNISNGDVGIFFVDGDMKCKQFRKDSSGNISLFSLNRQRADADMEIQATSGITIICYGKVLMQNRIPLP